MPEIRPNPLPLEFTNDFIVLPKSFMQLLEIFRKQAFIESNNCQVVDWVDVHKTLCSYSFEWTFFHRNWKSGLLAR